MYQKVDDRIEYLRQKALKQPDFGLKHNILTGINIARVLKKSPLRYVEMRNRAAQFTVIAAMLGLLALALSGCGDDGMDIAAIAGGSENPPDVLQGQVLLQNMDHHGAIRIELKEIDLSLLTDDEGVYSLPNEIAEGQWTVRASYPFFSAQEQSFTMVNGVPESDLKTMELNQEVMFDVEPEKLIYTYGETVTINLHVTNVVDYEVTLSSLTSPMTAFAVRHEGVTVVGGLFPGQGAEPQSVTLAPGETQDFALNWIIDNPELGAGEFQIYALLTVSETFPDYFTPDSETAAELNESLFDKLVPATITIQ